MYDGVYESEWCMMVCEYECWYGSEYREAYSGVGMASVVLVFLSKCGNDQ